MKLYENGAYLINGVELVEDTGDVAQAVAAKTGVLPDKEAAKKGTMAYGILTSHNISGNDKDLQIKFDNMTSHDITFVGSFRPRALAPQVSPALTLTVIWLCV